MANIVEERGDHTIVTKIIGARYANVAQAIVDISVSSFNELDHELSKAMKKDPFNPNNQNLAALKMQRDKHRIVLEANGLAPPATPAPATTTP
jgi:hypothetical protein